MLFCCSLQNQKQKQSTCRQEKVIRTTCHVFSRRQGLSYNDNNRTCKKKYSVHYEIILSTHYMYLVLSKSIERGSAHKSKAEPSQTAWSRKEIIGLWEKGPNQTNLAQSWLGRLTPLHLFHSGALFFYALQPINSTETLQTYFCLIYIEISKIPFLFTNVDRQKGPFKHVMITVETSFDETLAVAVAQKKMKQNSSKVQFASCQAK